MIRRICCLCAAAVMLCTTAGAEQWASIREIRAQTPAHWTQTYETPWRTIAIDAAIETPQVDRVPAVIIEGGATEPTLSAAQMGWDAWRYTGAYQVILRREYPPYPKKHNGVRLGTSYAAGNWYSGFAPQNRYVPLDDVTYGEIASRAKDAITALGYDPADFTVDTPVHIWAQHVGEYGRRNDVLPGYIFVDFLTRVEGIPVLSHVQESVRGDTGTKLGDSEFWQPVTSGLTYHGYLGDLSSLRLRPMKVCRALAEDVPLLPFTAIQSAIEEEIMAGHVRKIYEIRFGYVLFNEPGRFHAAKPGAARVAESHAARYYARPMWQVNCLYKETAAGKLRGKPGDSDDERNTLDYYQLLIDAQTCQVFRRSSAQDRCEYKGFISWEDVQ